MLSKYVYGENRSEGVNAASDYVGSRSSIIFGRLLGILGMSRTEKNDCRYYSELASSWVKNTVVVNGKSVEVD